MLPLEVQELLATCKRQCLKLLEDKIESENFYFNIIIVFLIIFIIGYLVVKREK